MSVATNVIQNDLIDIQRSVADNPYIHGTNSSIFLFLPKTGFRFLSPLDLMQNFRCAPMSGESGNNLSNLCINDGRMCFGRLRADTKNPRMHNCPKYVNMLE